MSQALHSRRLSNGRELVLARRGDKYVLRVATGRRVDDVLLLENVADLAALGGLIFDEHEAARGRSSSRLDQLSLDLDLLAGPGGASP